MNKQEFLEKLIFSLDDLSKINLWNTLCDQWGDYGQKIRENIDDELDFVFTDYSPSTIINMVLNNPRYSSSDAYFSNDRDGNLYSFNTPMSWINLPGIINDLDYDIFKKANLAVRVQPEAEKAFQEFAATQGMDLEHSKKVSYNEILNDDWEVLIDYYKE